MDNHGMQSSQGLKVEPGAAGESFAERLAAAKAARGEGPEQKDCKMSSLMAEARNGVKKSQDRASVALAVALCALATAAVAVVFMAGA